jgi:hypothetical protein
MNFGGGGGTASPSEEYGGGSGEVVQVPRPLKFASEAVVPAQGRQGGSGQHIEAVAA